MVIENFSIEQGYTRRHAKMLANFKGGHREAFDTTAFHPQPTASSDGARCAALPARALPGVNAT